MKIKALAIAALITTATGCTTVTGPVAGIIKGKIYGQLELTGSIKNEKNSKQYNITGQFPAQPAIGQVIDMADASESTICSMRVVDALYKDQALHESERTQFQQIITPQQVFGMLYVTCNDSSEGYLPYVIKIKDSTISGYSDGRAGNFIAEMKMTGTINR